MRGWWRRDGDDRARAARSVLVALAVLVGVTAPGLALKKEDPAPAAPAGGVGEAEGPPLVTPVAVERDLLRAFTLRGLRLEVVKRILEAEAGGELALAVLAVPVPGSDGKVSVPLFIEVDGPTFLQHNQASTARLEVYAYALTDKNEVAGYFAEVFAVDTEELGEAVWQRGLKYYGHLQLPPGSYTLRVLVRNLQSGAAGLRIESLEVPAAKTAAALSPPLFPGPKAREGWVSVQGPSRRQAAPPGALEERGLRPAAYPVAVAGREVEVYLLASDLPAGSLRLRGRVWAKGKRESRAEAQVTLVERQPVGSEGLEALSLRLKLPQLAPGEHRLEVSLDDPAGRSLRSAPTPLLLLSADTQERELLWTDVRWLIEGEQPLTATLATAQSARMEDQVDLQRRFGKRIRKLTAGYYEVLSLLGQDPPAAARAALLELESNALGRGKRKQLEILRAAELRVAKELAQADVESLLPILMLHHELYPTYRSRRLYVLVFHTRAMVESLAELYARLGGSQGSQIVAARVLASLAGNLQEVNLPAGCRRLYMRALDHDPRSRAALLGLAASLEKYGEYHRAIDYLERLVAAYPDFSEGLLRLAINQRRVGNQRRSRELLRRILDQNGPKWVRSLAYQELARSFIDSGALDQAEELLQAAVAELPEQQNAYLLLAHLYDRQRLPRQALDLVRTVEPQPGEGRDSARWIYDRWPRAELEEVRRSLEAAAAQRRPALARSVAAAVGG